MATAWKWTRSEDLMGNKTHTHTHTHMCVCVRACVLETK